MSHERLESVPVSGPATPEPDRFYRAFEDRYRGSRELVRERLEVYVPFIAPLSEAAPGADALDIGCGRGEWLELLAAQGFSGHGVDLDQGMLDSCHERGLSVTKADGLAFIAALPDASRTIVSAFHVAEHLPFSSLRVLVEQALRVLVPGGLLILETPNPENLTVGATNFYNDPTHEHPLPPNLLSFVPEFYGFGRVKVLRLQEEEQLRTNATPSLYDVLGGASPDYAVVAQKQAEPEIMRRLDGPFEAQYGLSLHNLSMRYEARTTAGERRVDELSGSIGALAAGMQEVSGRLGHAETRLGDIEGQVVAAFSARLDALENEARLEQQRLREEIAALRQSTSWRVTSPLRWVSSRLKGDQAVRHDAAAPTPTTGVAVVDRVLRMGKRSPLRRIVRASVRLAPSLERRLIARALSNEAGHPPANVWSIEPDPVDLSEWQALIASKKNEQTE